jgi:hypothetical protein
LEPIQYDVVNVFVHAEIYENNSMKLSSGYRYRKPGTIIRSSKITFTLAKGAGFSTTSHLSLTNIVA